ncbi:uncharacterized protein THITE_2020265, partial [Thermothielavioides terrestris NRRL 8126]
MKFEFIDSRDIGDWRTRRQIRSYVAKGRNAGRKLTRPSRKKAQEALMATASSPTALSAYRQILLSPPAQASVAAPFPRGSSVLLSSLPAHVQLTARSLGLGVLERAISFFANIRHPPELDDVLDYASEPRSNYIVPILRDEAYFHGAMAVFMAAFPSMPVSPSQDSTAARVRHLCVALRLVNARLSGSNAAADENVTVVMILALYERFQGSYHRGRLHLDGVRRMVEMRGGIGGFARSNPTWARKVFR